MHDNHTPKRNDEAVSPIIGVILMVAITVILAAVTVGYTMAIPQNLHSDTPIGISAGQLDENTVKITYIGPPRADEIAAITATLYAPDGTQLGTLTITDPVQGQAYSLSSATPLSSALEHVVIVARYWDDEESVILDTYL
jgi:flagellin-like protein